MTDLTLDASTIAKRQLSELDEKIREIRERNAHQAELAQCRRQFEAPQRFDEPPEWYRLMQQCIEQRKQQVESQVAGARWKKALDLNLSQKRDALHASHAAVQQDGSAISSAWKRRLQEEVGPTPTL